MSDRDAEDDVEPVPIDPSFDALNDPYRRSICRYAMRTTADTATHEELVDYVVDRAPETAAADPDRREIATELRHVHLPKLDEAGLIEHDRQRGVVHVDRATTATYLERVRETVADLQETPIDR
ncbi:DUF7344 domain-containing protein [Natrinema salaciae]|uniref:DUF7344 domain-containing protein n=1 Tax=Natrinema salaciae TaxID=1186196 RepID=A0A1H9LCJ6_9EURY|nr:hypothetical protein [Natrinema salaciae]SER08875.1 hypothetical protein SAMN04489841_2915 [Natrinema salaciae]